MNMEWERRRFDAVQVAEIRRASIHTAKIAIPCMLYWPIYDVKCLTGYERGRSKRGLREKSIKDHEESI